jgi:hypothetical protein
MDLPSRTPAAFPGHVSPTNTRERIHGIVTLATGRRAFRGNR